MKPWSKNASHTRNYWWTQKSRLPSLSDALALCYNLRGFSTDTWAKQATIDSQATRMYSYYLRYKNTSSLSLHVWVIWTHHELLWKGILHLDTCIDWEESSLCQWVHHHGRDGLRDEWQTASFFPRQPNELEGWCQQISCTVEEKDAMIAKCLSARAKQPTNGISSNQSWNHSAPWARQPTYFLLWKNSYPIWQFCRTKTACSIARLQTGNDGCHPAAMVEWLSATMTRLSPKKSQRGWSVIVAHLFFLARCCMTQRLRCLLRIKMSL